MNIVADKNIPFLKGVAESFGNVTYMDGADFTHQSVKNADALIVRTVTRFDENILKDTNIKLICSATIGFDHIDTAYCDAHGIAWRNAPGCNSGSVQQYITSSLIVLAGKHKFDLRDKTIGIVGVGNVGKKVADICRTLGMTVLLNDPPRQSTEGSNDFVDLNTIRQEADIITFHTPLIKDGEYKTMHLADEGFFSSLGRKPFIINSARGSIVDTTAIKNALYEKIISGVVVDCWENEPEIDMEYLNLADISTPHIAGYSADGKANATRMSLNSLADFFNLNKDIIAQIKAPEPRMNIIDMNKFSGADNRIYEAILTTHNPITESARLNASPYSFKQLRNEYPLRREFHAYTIVNASDDEKAILVELGFRLEI